MRKKKIPHAGSDIPSPRMFPAIDLDPVNNDQLHQDVWNQLRERLKGTSIGRTTLWVFKYCGFWCAPNRNSRNNSENVRPDTPANQTSSGIPEIGVLHLSETIPTASEIHPGPIPQVNYQSDNPSEGRVFGKNMRRLLKIVHRAILNPCELQEHWVYVLIEGTI